MTDENNKDKDLKEEGSATEQQEPKKEEKEKMPASVDSILQERLRLESEQAALDQMLKDQFQRNITVMFTDIKGSTSFFETYGDVEGRAMVQRHNTIMFPCVEQFGGKVIKTIGDAIMATFDDPAKGVRAAIEMQKRLQDFNKSQDQKHKKILVRIGLNYGPAVVEENDLFGDAVNVAARIESKTNPEQILISENLYKEVRTDDEIMVRFFGEVECKGKSEPVKMYRVIWSEEQLVVESEFKSAATRRTVDKRGKIKRGRIIEIIASREAKKMKVSVFERQRGEEKTVSHYEVVKIDDALIKAQCEEVVTLLNRANKRGKITKEIIKQLQASGQIMYDHLLSADTKEKILHTQAEHLIIRMDDHLVHIPWELLFDGKQFLCQRFSMGRIVSTRQKVAETTDRQIAKPLRMLVIADPRSDLPASKQEGTHIRDELDKQHEFVNVNLKASEVPTNFVKSKIRDYDLIHYAGHADYDSENPANSGWLLSDGKLTSGEISAMTGKKPMPALVFANGCQSGQTDEWKINTDYEKDIFGLANAFLISGVQHYIGTFWDILDDPGHDFALAFYNAMIAGCSVGESVRRARLSLIDKYGEETIVWATYMLYGDPSFSYLDESLDADEATDSEIQAPAPPPGQPLTAPGQVAVFRSADSMAMPMQSAGTSKSTIGIGIAVLVVLALMVGIYFKVTGGSVVIPEDAIAAGYMKLDKGDLEGALSKFRSLSDKKATRAAGLTGLAAVYLQKNDVVQSEQNAREALGVNPQSIKAHIVLGQIAYNRGDYSTAVKEYQAGTQGMGKERHKKEAFEKLAMAFNARGLASSNSGNRGQALKDYQSAFKANGTDAGAAINMGQSYLAMGNPAQAKEAFAQALSVNPNDSVASTLMAQAANMLALSQDAKKQEQVNNLVKDLAEKFRSGKVPAAKNAGDDWTSRPITITFLDFVRKGKMTMEGEDEFIKIVLTQSLRNTGKVEVVEREKIDRILQELNLASSALTNEDTRLRLGRLFGARLIATGSYIRYGKETQVNLRLIETETSVAKVAIAETFTGQDKPGDIAKTLAKALVKQIKKTYPVQGKISEVKTAELVKINVGSKVGVTKGMKMELLDRDLIATGTIEVTKVGPSVSQAKVIDKDGKISTGTKVREAN